MSVEMNSQGIRILQHIFYLLVFGGTAIIGIRPPWEVRWLFIPLMPIIIFFWLSVMWFFSLEVVKENKNRKSYRLLFFILVCFTAGYVLTSFGIDPSGRYFLPLSVTLSLVAAQLIRFVTENHHKQLLIVGVLGIYNFAATIECVGRMPPGLTTQFNPVTVIDHSYDDELIAFLNEKSELRGYSNYWVSYPLAFLSQEELIYVPRLPYHVDMRYTGRDDRYELYTEMVDSAENIAYITTHNPALDEHLQDGFAEFNVDWSMKEIGDYIVYFDLSEPIKPNQMGLGEDFP